ncbi:hypothetical protein [Brenneria populi]|uniref:GntT/GntP/DsdX family permease n=1 Tax=Brenneria populi TaxID=1505588 RepID=UPI00399A2DBA
MSLTPVTYCCKLLGIRCVAAFLQLELFWVYTKNFTVDPALMVLATGAGSVIACHVNDAGFWMIKESFGLSMKETFGTWTVLTTVLTVSGLVFILLTEALIY